MCFCSSIFYADQDGDYLASSVLLFFKPRLSSLNFRNVTLYKSIDLNQVRLSKGLIPRQRNSSREAVYAKYGWLGLTDSFQFFHFFRFRSE